MPDNKKEQGLDFLNYRNLQKELNERSWKDSFVGQSFTTEYRAKVKKQLNEALEALQTADDDDPATQKKLDPKYERFYLSSSMLGTASGSRYGLDTPGQKSYYNMDKTAFDVYQLPPEGASGRYTFKQQAGLSQLFFRQPNSTAQLYRIAMEDKGADAKLTIRFSPSKYNQVVSMLDMAALNAGKPPSIKNQNRELGHGAGQRQFDDASINFVKLNADGTYTYNKLHRYEGAVVSLVPSRRGRVTDKMERAMIARHKIARAAYHLRQAGLSPIEVQGVLKKYTDSLPDGKTTTVNSNDHDVINQLKKAELGLKEDDLNQAEQALKDESDKPHGSDQVGAVSKKELTQYIEHTNVNHLARYVLEQKLNNNDKKQNTAVYLTKKDKNIKHTRDVATDLGIFAKDQLKDKDVLSKLKEYKVEYERRINQENKNTRQNKSSEDGIELQEINKNTSSEARDESTQNESYEDGIEPQQLGREKSQKTNLEQLKEKLEDINYKIKTMEPDRGWVSKYDTKLEGMLAKGGQSNYDQFEAFMKERADAFKLVSELNIDDHGKKYEDNLGSALTVDQNNSSETASLSLRTHNNG